MLIPWDTDETVSWIAPNRAGSAAQPNQRKYQDLKDKILNMINLRLPNGGQLCCSHSHILNSLARPSNVHTIKQILSDLENYGIILRRIVSFSSGQTTTFYLINETATCQS